MEYGYILLKNHNILNNIKYKVGKRYKFNSEKNFIYCHKQLNEIDNFWDYDMIKKRGYKIDDDVCDKNLLW